MVELNKLLDTTIQFRFAKTRLRKYGYREPEPSQLFETLRTASSAFGEQDLELQFRFQHYLMTHSSVNGLLSEQTVQEMCDMIVENARRFLMFLGQRMLRHCSQEEGTERNLRINALVRVRRIMPVMGVDRRIIGLRTAPRQIIPQQGTQYYQNLVQPSNVASNNQLARVQPKAQPQKKGEKGKGKGKNKSKDDFERLAPEAKAKGRVRPAARALDWEGEENNED